MTRVMNQITATLCLSLCLPLFISLGGIHALDLGDYWGFVVAIVTSTFMSLILGILLRGIYVNWYDQKKNTRKVRNKFAEDVILCFFIIAATIAMPAGIYIAFRPQNYIIDTIGILCLLSAMYLYLTYTVAKKAHF